MRCLKCNRETEDNQVFCNECLEQMKKEPIKPGTPITLPKRPPAKPRVSTRPKIRPEEQIEALETKISHLHRWITALVTILLIVSAIFLYFLSNHDVDFGIGQNYSPMTTIAPTIAITETN